MKSGTALVPIVYRQALSAFSEGRRDDAFGLAMRVLDSVPDHAGAANLAGVIAKARDDLAASRRLLERALAAKPDYFEAAYNLGQACKAAEEDDRALQAFQHAASLKPDSIDSWLSLAFVALRSGLVDIGRQAARTASLVDPDSAEATHLIAIADLMEAALSSTGEGNAQNRQDPVEQSEVTSRTFFDASFFLIRLGFWNAAREVAARGVAHDPEHHSLANAYLETLLSTGDFETAERHSEAFFTRSLGHAKASQARDPFLEWSLANSGHFEVARTIRLEEDIRSSENGQRSGVSRLSFGEAVKSRRVLLPNEMDLEQFEAGLGRLNRQFSSPRDSRHRFRLVHTLCVRDEIDLIEANLAYHFRNGADCAIVTDNGSIDGTREKLEELASRWPILIVDEPELDYDQTRWTTRMSYLARDVLGAEWVILGDADEFWHVSGGNISSALDQCTVAPFHHPSQIYFRNTLMVPDFDRAQSRGYAFWEATGAFDRPLRSVDYRWISIEHSINNLLSSLAKTVVRASDVRLVAPGNHFALATNGEFAYSDDLQCLHYHIRSFEHFRKKARRNFEALSTGNEVHRKVAGSLLTLYLQMERNGSYLEVFERRTLAHPFMKYAEKVGRVIELSDIRAFIEAGMPVPALSPLSCDVIALSRDYLNKVERLLPRFAADGV